MRLLAKILMGALALLVLGIAFVLVPPHLQTRRIEPELPSEAQLRSLLGASDRPLRIRYVNTSHQRSGDRISGHSVFLIEWSDGRTFMIDSGMDRVAAAEFAELTKRVFGAGEAEIHGSIAELLAPEDIARVAGVGFTHLHIDHTQGLVPFCKARGTGATLHQTVWQAEYQNLHTREGAQIIADSCLAPGELSDGPLQTSEAFPGLGIAALGGHTPGSTLFAAAVGDRIWLFSGDITNSKAHLLENRGKGFFYSYLAVPENTARTQDLRLWLARLDAQADLSVVVSHDLSDIASMGMLEYAP